MMESLFFSSWKSLLHIFVVGVFGYLSLIIILRLSGNRTLSKMNSFDFVITIALGSTFSSALLDKNIALLDAIFSFFLLIGLQFIVTYISVRKKVFEHIIKGDPILLFHSGQFLKKAMKKAHVTEEEVLSGIREQGISDLSEVDFVVLEGNGKIIATEKSRTHRNHSLTQLN
jgi:uncharacterized membrane protein YcaP (DUF421 family)